MHGASEYEFSKEGVTQGDPLSMLKYTIAVLPLIQALVDHDKWDQNWYTDDSACCAVLPRLREWFDKLSELRPDFGYYPEPRKTILVVDLKDEAETHGLFDELGVSVVSGQHLNSWAGSWEIKRVLVSKWSRRCRCGCAVLRSSPKQQNHSPRQLMQHSPNLFSLSGPTCSE